MRPRDSPKLVCRQSWLLQSETKTYQSTENATKLAKMEQIKRGEAKMTYINMMVSDMCLVMPSESSTGFACSKVSF